MNRKLLSLLVTLVAMFGCLGSVRAEKLTLQSSDGSSKTDNVVTLALSDEFDVEDNNFRLAGKIVLGSTVPGTLSIVSNKPIKINSLIINGRIGIPGSANYTNSETGETKEFYNTLNVANSNKNLPVNSTFERKNINISFEGVQAANTVPTIYFNSIELDYEQYIFEDKCTKEWSEAGEDPTNGGNYYIYHPATKTFLTHVNNWGQKLSSTTNAYDAFLWEINPSGSSFNMKSGNYYFNISKNTILWNTSYNINLSQDTQTTEIKKSTTNTNINAFKIYRSDGNKYLNYDNSEFSASSNANVSNDWVFISEDQMNTYKAAHEKEVNDYKTAWDKALTLGNGESAEDIQALDEVMKQYQGANCNDFGTKTAGLNSIAKVKMTVSGEAHYGTFAAPFEVKLEDGITAWDVTEITDDKAVITQVYSPIPAYQPVILYNGSENVFNKVYYGVCETKVDDKSKYLVGVYDEDLAHLSSEDGYMLQYDKDNNKCEFRKGNNQKVSKNRAYLKVTTETAAGVKFRLVMPDETTEVSSVNAGAEVSSVYSLSGIKLDKMQKGVNIIKMSDGSFKKIIVK